ncbi:MAG TPA: WXG100 family type VII secretion target [Jatrophihabitantaceae bacterium]|jgi:WXG100 family type VII secretion target
MGEIHVQFESLLQGQAGIAQTYSRLTSTLEQLEQDLNPMVQSWTGAAQESYMQCKKQWDEAAANLASVLNSIGQAVGQAHENYRAAENAAQSNWS